MAKTKVVRPSERDLENYGTELLELDGWRSLKTDPVSRKEWGKGFGEPGMADRLYIRYENLETFPENYNTETELAALSQVLWIEWKALRGKAYEHQLEWIVLERSRGALVWLAGADFKATPEHFYEHYRASGLMRKAISAPCGKIVEKAVEKLRKSSG